ncbi:restriction endonuclease subunit S [Staphylococcus felis]|uniref:restriction endonuclease subunit S n=1 Tax=Staphylococcus felis TaxID=46127 RepID=UPI0021CFBC26|nr:restriction endonuclease subunit S [Staphylococcus felis]UXR86969.1 restriction endonuclease subunit S [Staphylococcus felis]
MSEQKRNIPKLRFPEFTEEWEEKKLGEIAYINDGTHNTPYYVEKGIPFYSVENVTRNDFINSKFITEDQYLQYKKRVDINCGDILMTRIGSIGEVKLVDWDYPSSFYVSLAIIKLYEGYLPSFILYLIQTNNTKKNIKANSLVTAIPQKINLIDLKKVNINLSMNLKEQEKIGTFFSKLDRLIELEEKKYELLEQQKKGYMQKIFSQELRFKDENGNDFEGWEIKRLKDVLEFSNKRTTRENEYPVLTSSRNGLILQSEYYKEGKTFADSNIGYFIIPKGYITYRSRSDDGKFQFNLNSIVDVGIVSKYYPVFKGINMNQSYLTMLMNYQLKKEYIKFATGTSQLVLSQKNLKEISTELPITEEQEKIGNFFDKQDNLIEKQSDKVELLKQRKQGFLQKMFV